MEFLYSSKKGVSEVTTFVLLTSLILVSSVVAYTFSQSLIDDKVAVRDKENMEFFLKKIDSSVERILSYDGAVSSTNLFFNVGKMTFEGNKVTYYSLVDFNASSEYCFDGFCVFSSNGYEAFYINLSSPYTFDSDFSLRPGSYIMKFTNVKNGQSIKVDYK